MSDSELDEQGRGEFILYTTEDGSTRVECRFEDNTIWLSQALIAQLYDRSKKTISEHLVNLFDEGELMADSVVRNFRTTAADGKPYDVNPVGCALRTNKRRYQVWQALHPRNVVIT